MLMPWSIVLYIVFGLKFLLNVIGKCECALCRHCKWKLIRVTRRWVDEERRKREERKERRKSGARQEERDWRKKSPRKQVSYIFPPITF